MIIKEIKVRRSERPQKTRVYVFEDGEGILDNLLKRHNRPHTAYKKEVLPLAKAWLAANKPEVTELSGDYKIRWSQKAGCSCGCSPGFIVDFFSRRDIFITITE
jgi:hypothetical protein